MRSRSVNKKFADAFGMEDLSPSELRSEMKRLGYSPNTGLFKKLLKSRGKSNFKDGGLAMAIEKVKAKEMKDGGVATPKKKPKNFTKTVEKQKRDKAIASGQLNIGDFNEMTPSMMEDFYKDASKVKKMKFGGKAVPSKFKGFSKLPEGVQQKIDPKLASKYEVGGEATPIMKGKRISESKKKQLLRREKEEMKKDIPVKKMKMGGKVEEYGGGGKVKGGKMSCRGMGAAIKGGGFSIR